MHEYIIQLGGGKVTKIKEHYMKLRITTKLQILENEKKRQMPYSKDLVSKCSKLESYNAWAST